MPWRPELRVGEPSSCSRRVSRFFCNQDFTYSHLMVIFTYNLKTKKMKRVDLKRITFSVENKTIRVSEKEVEFATQYEVVSAKTGNSMVFNLSHSTGTEFDPTTEWVYTSQEGIEFRVCNDPHITAQNARAYIKAKYGIVAPDF